MDAKIHRDRATLIYVASKVDTAHSALCKDLKSVKEVRGFYASFCLSRSYYLTTVWSLLLVFDDFDSLRKVGFDVDFHTSTLQHMAKDGDELANKAFLASLFGCNWQIAYGSHGTWDDLSSEVCSRLEW